MVTHSLSILQICLWLTVAFPKDQEGPWWDLLELPKWGQAVGEKAWPTNQNHVIWKNKNMDKMTFFKATPDGVAQFFLLFKMSLVRLKYIQY